MQVDSATEQRYRKEAPVLLDSIVGEENATIMKRDSKTDYCVKFDGGLCGIQNKYGEDFLGDACYFYPRSARKLGNELALTATLSCPEIARLSLFDAHAFEESTLAIGRLPLGTQDYLPTGITSAQAHAIHHAFLAAALQENFSAERNFMRVCTAAESLARITPTAWPDAVPFYLQHADASLPVAEPRPTDPVYLLQALCGLVAAAKHVHQTRLMQTIHDMESALHVTIRWETLAIVALPDSAYAVESLHTRWKKEWQNAFAPLLKRYLAMQLSLALFPFAGFGDTLVERAAIIGIRMATVRLALMSLCVQSIAAPSENDIVRVVQSLSRFLDHLSGASFSLQIYQETGWLKSGRLRALLGDGMNG